jgi:DNA-binding MarR family transcriptional regulator
MIKEYGYGYYFKRIHVDLEKWIHKDLSIYDLTKSQYDILEYLIRNSESSVCQKDLQEYFHLSNATINGIVKRLEQKGFVRRLQCEKDKRIVYIDTTNKTEQLSTKIFTNVTTVENKMVQGLSQNQQEELFELLDIVLKNIEMEESQC